MKKAIIISLLCVWGIISISVLIISAYLLIDVISTVFYIASFSDESTMEISKTMWGTLLFMSLTFISILSSSAISLFCIIKTKKAYNNNKNDKELNEV